MAKKPRPTQRPHDLSAADHALWVLCCECAILFDAQRRLNAQFREGERPGDWEYVMERVPRDDPEKRWVIVDHPVAWSDTVEALARFRVAAEAAAAALPVLAKLMDSKSQAIPERWTFRVRMLIAELRGLYGDEALRRQSLKAMGRPEEEASLLLRWRPMNATMTDRFGELNQRLSRCCFEVALALDPGAEWPRAVQKTRELRDEEADNEATKSMIGTLLAGGMNREQITLRVLEEKTGVPDSAIQKSRAWESHMKARRRDAAPPPSWARARKSVDTSDGADHQNELDALIREQRTDDESRY